MNKIIFEQQEFKSIGSITLRKGQELDEALEYFKSKNTNFIFRKREFNSIANHEEFTYDLSIDKN